MASNSNDVVADSKRAGEKTTLSSDRHALGEFSAADRKRQLDQMPDTVEKNIRSQLIDVLVKAQESSDPIVQRMLSREREHREARSREMAVRLQNAREDAKGKDPKKLQGEVLATLQANHEMHTSMNAAIKNGGFTPGGKTDPSDPKSPVDPGKVTTFYVTNNKGIYILPNTIKLAGSEFFDVITASKEPVGYEHPYIPRDITILGENPRTLFGSGKGSEFATLLITTSLVAQGVERFQDLRSNTKDNISLEQSVLMGFSPLPTKFDLSAIDARVAKFSYAYSFDKPGIASRKLNGYSFIQGGYIFGGRRDTMVVQSYEDCTSWTSKEFGCPFIYTSGELPIFHERISQQQAAELPLDKISDQRTLQFSGVHLGKTIRDPQRDLRPGDLYQHPGHTAGVIDFISAAKDSCIVGMAFSRAIDEKDKNGKLRREDGLGVQLFPYPGEKKMLIFSTKGQLSDTPLRSLAAGLGDPLLADVSAGASLGVKSKS